MKNRHPRIKYIALLIVASVVGVLLAVSVYLYFGSAGSLPAPLTRSGLIYVIIALLIALPVLLAVLLAFVVHNRMRGGRNRNEKKKFSDSVVNAVRSVPDMAVSDEVKVGKGVSRFGALTDIDRQRSKYEKTDYVKDVDLKTFCERFRNFAASLPTPLYYDIADIRRFVAGLGVSHILILQGMSGTGKTSLAYAFGEFVGNTSTVIPVQPMWKERTDLLGYYNEFTKRFNETTLLKTMYEANYSKDMYITVLDEMNIARVEYYFAEFLSMLELPKADERYLDVVTDRWDNDPKQLVGGKIGLPDNMWFVGTANNDDSTFAISDKVYDRAMILNLDNKAEAFAAESSGGVRISAEKFAELIKNAEREYGLSMRNRRRLEALDEYMIEHFHITFGNRIMKQISEYVPIYVACGGGETEALDDILSKKVLRKLEMQNPVYVKRSAEGFCAYLDESFGEDGMPLCKAFVRRLEKNA